MVNIQTKELVDRILDTFENEDIKEFTKQVVSDLPEYWWTVPASSSGKYHPEYALGDGGLVRHSVAVVRFLNYFFELEQYQEEFNSRERDLLRLAGLVHDGRKQGTRLDEEDKNIGVGHTVFAHPQFMADFILDAYVWYIPEDITSKEITYVSDMISSHMGQWNTCTHSDTILPKPTTSAQKLLHLADYLASRKSISIDFSAF